MFGVGAFSEFAFSDDGAASTSVSLSAGVGSLTFAGLAATVSVGGDQTLTPGAGAIVVTGLAAGVSASVDAAPGAGAITITGNAPTLDLDSNTLYPGAGGIVFTGAAADVSAGVNITPGTGAVVFSGRKPTFAIPATLTAGLGAIVFTGLAATWTGGVTATPGASALTFTGLEATVGVGPATVRAGRGTLRFIGLQPTVSADVNVTAGLGGIVFGETGELGGANLRAGLGEIVFRSTGPASVGGDGGVVASLVQRFQADALVELYELDATAIGGTVHRWTPGPFMESETGRLAVGGSTTVVALDREVELFSVLEYNFIVDRQDGLGIQQADVVSAAVVSGVTEVTLATPLDEAPLAGAAWTLRGSGHVAFGGVTYTPMAIKADGFEMNGRGQLPTPTLRMPNNPYINALVNSSSDLLGAKVTRLRTFKRFLDGMPHANPNAILAQPDIFRVDRKARQSRGTMEFELAAWIDQQGIQIPRRQVIANTCGHTYRRWNGSAFVYGTCPFADDELYEFDNTPTGDPSKDVCSKKMKGCLTRFGEAANLPIRAFPGSAII
jgi:lambda family phage minor tail protein L